MNILIEDIIDKEQWSIKDTREFSSNDVISAYLKGKEIGFNESKNLILKALNDNFKKSSNVIDEIIAEFKKYKINPIAIFLKVNNWNDFDILILISEEDYLSENLLLIYDYLGSLEEKNNEPEFYNICISIVDKTENFNFDCISSEGFIFKHKLNVN